MRFNNIDLAKVAGTVEAIRRDPNNAKRATRVEGEWVFDDINVQFRADVKYEKGSTLLEMSLPTFMGGEGSRPGPIHYCVYGLASCFLATVLSIATERNLMVRKARIVAECRLDFSKTFGVADRPIAEGVRFEVELDADADKRTLEELLSEAEERCPAVYSLRYPVKVEARLI